jgi:hypothetical protein
VRSAGSAGAGHFLAGQAGGGSLPGDLIDYTPTEPLLVVEVDTDMCFDHQRWRHATAFQRVRRVGSHGPVDIAASQRP